MENWDEKEFGTDIRKVGMSKGSAELSCPSKFSCIYPQFDPETDTWDQMPVTLETPINAVGAILMDELEVEC